MSPNYSASRSESLSQFRVIESFKPGEDSLRSLSRVRIQLEVDTGAVQIVRTTLIRLAERYVPGVPKFVISEGNTLVLRLRYSYIRALQIDQLVCRLNRLKGVQRVNAELRRTGRGIVYSARMRGR